MYSIVCKNTYFYHMMHIEIEFAFSVSHSENFSKSWERQTHPEKAVRKALLRSEIGVNFITPQQAVKSELLFIKSVLLL